MAADWLKNAIVEYLRNRSDKRPNSIDICSYFKMRVDLTYSALRELEAEGRVVRHDLILGGWNGNHYYQAIGGSFGGIKHKPDYV